MAGRKELVAMVDIAFAKIRSVFAASEVFGEGEIIFGSRYETVTDLLSQMQVLMPKRSSSSRRDDGRMLTQILQANVIPAFHALLTRHGLAARISWAHFMCEMTQEGCGEYAGCHPITVNRYLNGKTSLDIYRWWAERFEKIALPWREKAA